MKTIVTIIALLIATSLSAQVADSSKVEAIDGQQLSEVTVSAHKAGRIKMKGLSNGELISSNELLRAACCNLGERINWNKI